MAEEVMGPKEEPTTVVLLCQHDIQLPSKLLWVSYNGHALTHCQRSFSFAVD